MRKRKLLSLLVLLMTAVTGAWADADVTWNSSNVSDIRFWGGAPDGWDSYTKEGIMLRGNAEECNAEWDNYGYGDGINFNMNASGGYTFTALDGKKFTKIEMTIYSYEGWYDAAYDNWLGSGWPGEDAAMTVYSTNKVTWTGDATSTVDLLTDAGLSSFGGATVSSIDFYFEAPSGPTIVASGDCGTGVTWSLTDDGTLTISGTGAMADYASMSDSPWYSNKNSITSIVVGEGVTHIGNSAFRLCNNVTSISLPTSLTSIGNNAFRSCNNAALTSITIPENVTSIGNYAFMSCSGLTTVTIPDKVTTIGNSAFSSCTGLTSVTIGNSVTSIDQSAFEGCNNAGFTTVTIPNSVESIGQQAFYNCTGLTSVTIGNSVTSIGIYAFRSCSNLTTVTIYAANAPSLGKDAFNSCPSGLKTYVFSDCTGNYDGWPGVTAISVTANSDGAGNNWATYYNELANVQMPEGTQVFKVALTGSTLEMTEITDRIVNAGQDVVLKSSSASITLDSATSASETSYSGNSLLGTMTSITNPGNAYVLNGVNGVGFYKLSASGTIGANKAYLTYSGGGAAATRGYFLFDEATGIEMPTVEDVNADAVVYDLQGRRVQNPTKGLYIVRSAEGRLQGKNGKKVFINK